MAARSLADRICNNTLEWNLDGVDFFFAGHSPNDEGDWNGGHGVDPRFHKLVIQSVRQICGDSKTISYSTIRQPFSGENWSDHIDDEDIIMAIHPWVDYITIGSWGPLGDAQIERIKFLGIPMDKLGLMIKGYGSLAPAKQAVDQVKEMGMAGVTLWSINKENEYYQGELARRVAEWLYL
jgi:hypothetical protein